MSTEYCKRRNFDSGNFNFTLIILLITLQMAIQFFENFNNIIKAKKEKKKIN